MVMVTKSFALDVGNNLFKRAWTDASDIVTSDWQRMYTVSDTDQLSPETFAWAGFDEAVVTGELKPPSIQDLRELHKTSATLTKYSKGGQISEELIKSGRYIPYTKQLAVECRRALEERREIEAYEFLNNATSTSYHVDAYATSGVALCQTHTTLSGDTLNNAPAAASLDPDTLFSELAHFKTNLITQRGVPTEDTVDTIVYNVAKEADWLKLRQATGELNSLYPGNPNILKTFLSKITFLPTIRTDSTTARFYLGSRFKAHNYWYYFFKGKTKSVPNELTGGLTIFAYDMYGNQRDDATFILMNAGL